MAKKLVAYFSASGITKGGAGLVANEIGAELFEIVPKEKYTKEDLNWMDKKSRSSIESNNKSSRPEIASGDANITEYDEVILGFPIWWYVAPMIINTFLESYDFTGKKITLFATSGGSGFGNTVRELQPSAPKAVIIAGKILNRMTDQEIRNWAKEL